MIDLIDIYETVVISLNLTFRVIFENNRGT